MQISVKLQTVKLYLTNSICSLTVELNIDAIVHIKDLFVWPKVHAVYKGW